MLLYALTCRRHRRLQRLGFVASACLELAVVGLASALVAFALAVAFVALERLGGQRLAGPARCCRKPRQRGAASVVRAGSCFDDQHSTPGLSKCGASADSLLLSTPWTANP